VTLTRAEGPAVNSPARDGRGTGRVRVRGPQDRHSDCAAPSALLVVRPDSPASRPGLRTVGPTGLAWRVMTRATDPIFSQLLRAGDSKNPSPRSAGPALRLCRTFGAHGL
jgi:hypothetical protein